MQNGLNWCNKWTSSCHKIASEFSTTNAPDPPHWTLNSYFRLFHSVWVHLGSFRYCMKLGAKWAELVQLLQKFVPRSRVRIFTMNAFDPPHWTLNSCFSAFRVILGHWGPFGWVTKLGAKQAELVQKFVPQSRVGIFRNQQTQSTPLDPELMFWCVLYNFGAFGTVCLSYKTRCKTGGTGAKVFAKKSL